MIRHVKISREELGVRNVPLLLLLRRQSFSKHLMPIDNFRKITKYHDDPISNKAFQCR